MRFLRPDCLLRGVLLLLTLVVGGQAQATHVRAGEIIARPDSLDPLVWDFTIFIYRDKKGINAKELLFFPGDLITPVKLTDPDVTVVQLPDVPDTEVWIYRYRHRYSASQAFYTARAVVENRNANVINFGNGNSSIYSFYVETRISLDRLNVGINNSPILTNPPVERACTGRLYKHNPAAVDPDGDSLSYRLILPRYSNPDPGPDGEPYPALPAYQSPEAVGLAGQTGQCFENGVAVGAASFTLYSEPVVSDSIAAGDLVWCTPARAGEYNVAFEIREWRRDRNGVYREIGYVVRDMQILVEECINRPPQVVSVLDTCVIAGDTLLTRVQISDPDGDAVNVRAEGGPLLLWPQRSFFRPLNRPSFSAQPTVPDPIIGELEWRTSCVDVRRQPYQVLFVATDVPAGGPGLTDLKTLRIRVVAPPPQGLVARAEGGGIVLEWDGYACGNASQLVVYRRQGSFDFERFPCQEGVPAGSGYVEVGRVEAGQTRFEDQSQLALGVNYCYRLVAVFPEPGGGVSIASQEACARLALSGPVLLNVSVEATSPSAGRIGVVWSPPLELDSAVFAPPYRYLLSRRRQGEAGFVAVFESGDLADTSFVDQGLDTEGSAYAYELLFFASGQPQAKDSAEAGSVRLEALPAVGAITLRWRAQVPWNNAGRFHYLYRGVGQGAVALYDSVLVGGGPVYGYTDRGTPGQGLDACQRYHYFVVSNGTYDNVLLRSPLLNNSQLVAASPLDTLPPLPPELVVDTSCNCVAVGQEQELDLNRLSWTAAPVRPGSCDTLAVRYRVYYGARPGDTLALLAEVGQTRFDHGRVAGCYEVRTVDASGNLSEASNRVCVDNCWVYDLPNVFSPNGDGVNELFVPRCYTPASIRSVRFRVYNRWGRLVFETSADAAIRWDGRSQGSSLPVGTYFYLAEVDFIRLRAADERRIFKSWVQIMR